MNLARAIVCTLLFSGAIAASARGQTYIKHRWHPSLAKSPMPNAAPVDAQGELILGSEGPDDVADPAINDGVLVINQVSARGPVAARAPQSGSVPKGTSTASGSSSTKKAQPAKATSKKSPAKSTTTKSKRQAKR